MNAEITRRDFLKTILFAGATLAVAGDARPKSESLNWIPFRQTDFWQRMNGHGDMLPNSPLRPDKDGNWPVSPNGEIGSWEGQWGMGENIPGWKTGLEEIDHFRISIDYIAGTNYGMGRLDEPVMKPIRRSSIWVGGNGFPEIEVAFGESKEESVVKWNGQEIARTKKEKDVSHNYTVERRGSTIGFFLDGNEITVDADGQPLEREISIQGGPPKAIFGGQNWSGCEDPTGVKTGADCLYGGWAPFRGQITVYQSQPAS